MDDLFDQLLADKPKPKVEEPESQTLTEQSSSQDSKEWIKTGIGSAKKAHKSLIECFNTEIPKELDPSNLVWAKNDRFSNKALKVKNSGYRNWFPARLCEEQEGMFLDLGEDWPIPSDKRLVEWININKEEPVNKQKEVRFAKDIIPYCDDVCEVRTSANSPKSLANSPKDRRKSVEKDNNEKTPASASSIAKGIMAQVCIYI